MAPRFVAVSALAVLSVLVLCVVVLAGPAADKVLVSGPAGEYSAGTRGGAAGEVEYIVFDTDMGLDDILALSVVLADTAGGGRRELAAVTIVDGLAHPHKAYSLVKSMLSAAGRPDVPVGLTRTLCEDDAAAHCFPPKYRDISDSAPHLFDGVVIPPVDPTAADPARAPAAEDVLLDAVRAHRAVTLVGLGPMTNVYAAIKKDGELMRGGVTRFVTMAGAVKVPGNAPNEVAEWNVYADITNATRVFNDAGFGGRRTMAPLDVCFSSVWKELRAATKDLVPTTVPGKFIYNIIHGAADTADYQYSYDPTAVVGYMYPGVFTSVVGPLVVTAEGRTVMGGAGPEFTVLLDLDRAQYAGVYGGYITQAPSGRAASPFSGRRPDPQNRLFVSPAIDQVVETVTKALKDDALAAMFEICFPNPLDTTVNFTANYGPYGGLPDTFILTGDIPAMWLRDSMSQVWPYLPYVPSDEKLKAAFEGALNRMVDSVLVDPYANAFVFGSEGSPWKSDARTPPMTDRLWEGKYELDSLMSVLRLSYGYYAALGKNDTTVFSEKWVKAVAVIIDTVRGMQRSTRDDVTNPNAYRFKRTTDAPTDTLWQGMAWPGAATGMSRSPFRPSDDATTFPYLVPANYMAVVSLRQAADILKKLPGATAAAQAALAVTVAGQIEAGLREHAVVLVGGQSVLAYEVDGYGNALFMDDGNSPSLMSLAYLGALDPADPLYVRTRAAALSGANPFYVAGPEYRGMGSPHTGLVNVWPMGLLYQALTSNSDDEITALLTQLKTSTAGTGFIHESFLVTDPTSYSRPWFAWANSLFGELMLKLASTKPHLVLRPGAAGSPDLEHALGPVRAFYAAMA